MKTIPLTAAFLASLCLALPGTAGATRTAADGGTAHTSQSCKPPRYPGNGYFTSLSVRHTTCSFGRKLALAYYHCRTRHGIRGKCSGVLHYSCKETRQSIPTEFDARVTCVHGSRKVVHTYQQNT